MSQILYFTDEANGTRHGTFVHSGGHILLRDVPADKVEDLKETVREWRNTLSDVEKVTAAEVTAFLEDQGFPANPDFNPPLVAYNFEKPDEAPADPDSLAAMTVPQLRAYAAELGLDLGAEMKKAEIVEAITAKLNSGNTEGGGS